MRHSRCLHASRKIETEDKTRIRRRRKHCPISMLLSSVSGEGASETLGSDAVSVKLLVSQWPELSIREGDEQ